jgi:hypothetical protein
MAYTLFQCCRSGSRRAKMTNKNLKSEEIPYFEVLDVFV